MTLAQLWPAIMIVSATLITAPIVLVYAWKKRDRHE